MIYEPEVTTLFNMGGLQGDPYTNPDFYPRY